MGRGIHDRSTCNTVGSYGIQNECSSGQCNSAHKCTATSAGCSRCFLCCGKFSPSGRFHSRDFHGLCSPLQGSSHDSASNLVFGSTLPEQQCCQAAAWFGIEERWARRFTNISGCAVSSIAGIKLVEHNVTRVGHFQFHSQCHLHLQHHHVSDLSFLYLVLLMRTCGCDTELESLDMRCASWICLQFSPLGHDSIGAFVTPTVLGAI